MDGNLPYGDYTISTIPDFLDYSGREMQFTFPYNENSPKVVEKYRNPEKWIAEDVRGSLSGYVVEGENNPYPWPSSGFANRVFSSIRFSPYTPGTTIPNLTVSGGRLLSWEKFAARNKPVSDTTDVIDIHINGDACNSCQCEPGAMTAKAQSVHATIGLGRSGIGDSRMSLALDQEEMSARLSSRDALTINGFPSLSGTIQAEVIRDIYGIRQVLSAQVLADIVTINAYKYEVRLYHYDNRGTKSGDFYQPQGSPFKTITFRNPNGAADTNTLEIVDSDVPDLVKFRFAWNPTQKKWLFTSHEQREEELVIQELNSNGDYTETRTVREIKEGVSTIVQKEKSTYKYFKCGEAGEYRSKQLTERILDPGGANLRTAWDYYEYVPNETPNTSDDLKVKWETRPDKSWTSYKYDSKGREIEKRESIDTAFSEADPFPATGCRLTVTGYSGMQTTVDEKIGNDVVRRTIELTQYNTDGTRSENTYVCLEDDDLTGTATNLVTSRLFKGNAGESSGLPIKTINPDGTATLYSYSPQGANQRITASTGQYTGSAILNGIQVIRDINRAGHVVYEEVRDITNGTVGLLISSYTATAVDQFGRPTQLSYDDGTTISRSYDCCGIASETDRNGVTTIYGYDVFGNQNSILRDGVEMITTNDVFGRSQEVKRVGSLGANATTQIVAASEYDLAGRLKETRDAMWRLTTFSEVIEVINGNEHLVRTTTNPDGGQRVEKFYKDGRLLSVGGTAAPSLKYEYRVEPNVNWSIAIGNDPNIAPTLSPITFDAEVTKEIRLGPNGETTEWTETYRDMAGRVCKIRTANNGWTENIYNLKGQLWRTRDADATDTDPNTKGVHTLFAYNGKGEHTKLVVDMDQDNVVDDAGSDRVTETTRSVVSANGVTVQRTTVSQKYQDTSGAAVVAFEQDVTPNGRKSWTRQLGQTTSSETILNGSGVTTTTTTYPDGSIQVEQRDHGRVTSSQRSSTGTGTIGDVSYTYADPFKRLTSTTDARNGTTSYTYWEDDQVKTLTTPAPGDGSPAQTTTYHYDASGRQNRVIAPDGGQTRSDFWPHGGLKASYGVRTYPVEYTYDAQLRLKTLTTHRADGPSGVAVTTWNYHSVTGLLENKRYNDNVGPSYTYTLAGRIYERTWARNVTTRYIYNNAGQVGTIDYLDGTPDVVLTYDRRGILSGMTDASGTRSFPPNSYGQPGAETYTSGMFNGMTIGRVYDTLQRLQTVSFLHNDDGDSVTYGYDGASRLQTVNSGSIQVTYSYEPNSSLISQIAFDHSGANRLTTTRSFDNLNRLQSISSSTFYSQSNPAPGMAYGYSSANQRTSATAVDGSKWQYSYDLLGQVTEGSKRWADGSLVKGQQYGYKFDQIGNRVSTSVNGRTFTYTPNALNQYGNRSINPPDVTDSVDILGTAAPDTAVSVNGQPATRQGDYFVATLPVSNGSAPIDLAVTTTGVKPNGSGTQDVYSQLTGNILVPKTPEAFGYDADGNLIADGLWTYTWDGENRLIGMESQSTVPAARKLKLTFKYDGLGRRVEKLVYPWVSATSSYSTTPTTVRRFNYDGWNLLAEWDSNNLVLRSYVWGLDLSGSMQGAGGVGGLLAEYDATVSTTPHEDGYFFPTYDGNGNILSLVDAVDGSIDALYEYGPFGEMIRSSGARSSSNPFRWSTKYADQETGLAYYGYRYYHAQTGRWLSRDPIEERGGTNMYSFIQGNPLSYCDRLGLEPNFDFGGSNSAPYSIPTTANLYDFSHYLPVFMPVNAFNFYTRLNPTVYDDGSPGDWAILGGPYLDRLRTHPYILESLEEFRYTLRGDARAVLRRISCNGTATFGDGMRRPLPGRLLDNLDTSLTLGKFILFLRADCTIVAKKTGDCCRAQYGCAIKVIVRDTYDFEWWMPTASMGSPYRIHGEWTYNITGWISN